ncbi:MAG: DUF5050 domain-containing protein [Flavobacteriaceae bacterium]|nr:DUF5050 domain-containing protein [Flavobacteriaceae bacterium]
MKTKIILFSIFLMMGCKKEHKTVVSDHNHELKIAYNVFYDENNDDYEVFSMNLDGSNKKNITELKGVEWTYYAFNDKVYYVSDDGNEARHYNLYSMNFDGTEKTKISDIRLADSWQGGRNNGSEFIVKPHHTVDTAFYVINTKGELIQEIKPELAYFHDPTFSPDGKQIVFRGAHYSSKREPQFIDEIYIMNSDGSNLKQLSHYPENDTTAMWYAYKAGPPKWHPTENFISYSSFQNGKYRLFAVAPNGAKQWELIESDKGHVYHDWSPDGKWLVMDAAQNDAAPFHIELLNFETKKVKVLTDSTYNYHQAPVFVKAN